MLTGPLFLKLRECFKKICILQGGGDAGKTVAILQHLAVLSIERRNQITTVTAQTIPAVKAGALRAFQKYVLPDFAQYIIKYNETSRTYYFYNGSIIEFKSYKDELSAQGSERDNLFMNECNHETYQTFWQLQRKTRGRIYLDYNPVGSFWVHDKLLPGESQEKQFRGKVQRYISDHRHNPFLTQDDHDNYENISDPDLFRVYSRGLTGKIKGLIFGHFRKWESLLLPDRPQRIFWGIDYGYTNDPTAIVKVAIDGRRRVAKEFAYKTGLSAEEIKDILIVQGGYGQTPGLIEDIWSEADPNMVNQLVNLGLAVQPAIKGPGSKIAGISVVKQHECFYTPDSVNFEKEIGIYKWTEAEDVVTGKTVMTNVPVDGWDHCCDAFRMGDYTDKFRYRAA